MKKDVFADTRVHPNLALTENLTQRPICCLTMENADDAKLCVLGVELVHVYRQASLCAVLFELPKENGWQTALERRLAGLGLTAGMSGPFALAASAHGCMRKAELALETGARLAPHRALYPMSEYSEAALIEAAKDVLAREGFEAADFCDAAVMQMTAQDRQTGTQFAQSLHAYLSHGLDMKRAAQALHIHRNTLDYRMKRVQERFALNLSDVNTCFELLFSFWLTENFQDQKTSAQQTASFDPAGAQEALWRYMEGGQEAKNEPAPAYACRLLGVGVKALSDEGRAALLKVLSAMMPQESACAFDEDMLLFALPPERMDGFETACRVACERAGCAVIVTQTLRSARLTQKAKLCRMALYAAPQGHVRMQDIGSMLFFMVLERRLLLSPYLCEEVIRVMDDDAMRGAALSASLYAYLLNFMDMKRAASQLGMHRNTMEYQMRKIDALIGKPASQGQRFLMMCTYKMLALPDMQRFGL